MLRRRRYGALLFAAAAVLVSACSSTPAKQADTDSPSITTLLGGATSTVPAAAATSPTSQVSTEEQRSLEQPRSSQGSVTTVTTGKSLAGPTTTMTGPATSTTIATNGPQCPNPKTCDLYAFLDGVAKGWRPGPDGIARIPFYLNSEPPKGSTLPAQAFYDAFVEGTVMWEAANPRIDFQLKGATGGRLQRQGDKFSDFAYGASVLWIRDTDGYIIEADIVPTPADPDDSLAYTPCDWRRDGGCNPSASDKLEILNTIFHEIGHALGLGDLRAAEAQDLTMYTQTHGAGDRRRVTVGKGDLTGLHILYPCGCARPLVYAP